MATGKEDQELEFELQELYLTGKQWLSDIAFLEEELVFLTELMDKSPFSLHGTGQGKQEEIMVALSLQNAAHKELKWEVNIYMNKLEPLIIEPNIKIGMLLIEDYIRLKEKVANSLLDLKSLKYACVNVYRNDG